MNLEQDGFRLTSTGWNPAPALTGVQASGRLEGVLFTLTLRQTYRNTSDRVLELVYTFPLPMQAVLLGFAAELNGGRLDGTIVARPDAEREYEEALAGGDAPVLLEALGNGLHTANVGNLKPGEEMVLEVRYAQVLAFEQGRLRLTIPTTIAPRYGSAQAAGLQPQQVPQATLDAGYALALSVTVAGSLAGAAVECPTHPFTRLAVEGGARLDLAAGARLDRDVVIRVRPADPRSSLVIHVADARSQSAPVVLMAALQPPPGAPRKRITLKVLVDCSGSMAGDSIASARAALRGVLGELGDLDELSLSRFGSHVEHLQRLAPCKPRALRQLGPVVDAIQADLGGTEMEDALRAVFRLGAAGESGADVLLLTDGEIWQSDELVASARASGHRIFAIGVGSAPAEGVLRALAEATGGACEFATPGEALQAAARRMLVRIRQQPWRDVRIAWGAAPLWQTALPAAVFGGDTVIAFAGVAALEPQTAVRLLATDAQGVAVEVTRGVAGAASTGDDLPRIAAARRLTAAGARDALKLALDYQLLGPQTHCILVHRRAEADKATEAAELQRVSSMLAAGWGATGSVMVSAGIQYSMAAPDAVQSCVNRASDRSLQFSKQLPDAYRQALPPSPHSAPPDLDADITEPASIEIMVLVVVEHLEHGGSLQRLAAHCQALTLHPTARAALDQAVQLGAAEGQAWLVLAHWANSRGGGIASAWVAATLQPQLDGVDAVLVTECLDLFERALGRFAMDSWMQSRGARLTRAMARITP